ncbi:adhesive plaque matrix protein [Hemiscyllium ocellatum]|uniref:adhesive plaque matrix protein n=1 Tax=Hemiscyllium ocellatum TaxID=170820 RepID=UPI00296635CF|nr:adhesive plaque matrix protein [Hemiscyllium ocellatum]
MGIKMLMAVTTLPATSHYVSPNPKPPPLAPKPDKDNIKLQKILKRAAKRKAAQTYLQAMDVSDKFHSYLPKPFRSSLSPVNETSPDLEYYEHHSRSPRSLLSPRIPSSSFPPYRQGPTIVTHAHVASPYPAHKSFYKGKIELLPKIEISTPQSPAENQNQAQAKLPPPIVPAKIFTIPTFQPGIKAQELPKFSVPPRFSPSIYTPRSWSTTEVTTANISTTASKAFKGPEVPEFHVTDTSGANGPNINVANAVVPGVETYTAKMVINEVEQESFLNSLQALTPTYEAPRGKTPIYEGPAAKTPIYEGPATMSPTYDVSRARTPTYDTSRARTPTYEPPAARTPTYEASRARTPTYEASRARTPTYEPPAARTPTYEASRARTPTYEASRARTPTYEPPAARTPTYEASRARTPTYEASRARTPTYEPPAARTPTYELPVTMTPTYEPPTAKTPTYEAPRARTPTHEATRSRGKYDPLGANTLQNEGTQENLTEKAANTSAIGTNDLTAGIGAIEIEIQRMDMPTQKTKSETKSSPTDIADETLTHKGAKALPKAEPQLKSPERVKPLKSKISGWTRLKKHMIVEEEPPKFPEPEPNLPEARTQEQNQDESEAKKQESKKAKVSRANKMWDAVLFQMFAAQQHKHSEQESNLDNSKQMQQATPVFSSRLPLLLFKPRFDARKLKEAAERPLRKISTTLIESGLHRKGIDDEELKDFNRTAKGWPTQQKEIS